MTGSYVRGADTPPLLEETIGAALERAADKWQRRAAIIAPFQNIHWTYEELNARADALATGFLELGLEPGDRIGIWAPNCAEWTLTQFAAAKVGVILVTINPAYRKSELDYALNKAGCRVLVLAEAHRGVGFALMLRELVDEKKLPCLEHALLIGKRRREGFLAFDDIAATKADDRVAKTGAALKNTGAINIQFTSGTTGFPKGATLSHRNILNNGFFVGESIGLSPEDKLCIPVPLYHCFGMVMGNLGCLTHGSAMVYPSEGFDPQAVLQTVQDEKCTALYGVPTMFIAELGQSDFPKFDLSSLRTGIMAGSPCPIEVMRHVIDKMHMREVTIAYGMTETSPVSFQSSRSDSIERRVSTVGRVLPHVEVKIVDENGQTVPRGVAGELCTRGPSVMLGYWDDEAKTAEAIDADGWMHTGDIGTIDDEGYGNIVGRIKDMVIRGGENIYPREIEEFLYRHPKVADVTVVGLPDE
ncbi:MAG TPA: AMP-binding protein, partial [Rhizomicrobium sp.]